MNIGKIFVTVEIQGVQLLDLLVSIDDHPLFSIWISCHDTSSEGMAINICIYIKHGGLIYSSKCIYFTRPYLIPKVGYTSILMPTFESVKLVHALKQCNIIMQAIYIFTYN